MANAREVEQRIKSVKNIAQVTRALQAVSASKVKKSTLILEKTRPYTSKAWQVLLHIAGLSQGEAPHPLLKQPANVKNVVVVVISGDRGLAGAYYSNLMHFMEEKFDEHPAAIRYITVGSKARDILLRQGKEIMAEFSNLPADPTFVDVAPIGRLAVDDFLTHTVDEVYLVYTDFVNMIIQNPTVKKLLPLTIEGDELVSDFLKHEVSSAEYIYEPGREEILDNIIPRFTALQVFHAVLEALASEHAARMVAMKNATDNATDLASSLQLEYNKARQQAITNELLDIAGGAEALEQSL